MRVLVTGASGFVGRALVNDLAAQGHRVRAAMRQPADIFPRTVEVVAVSDLARPIEWRPLLRDMEAVVHLAGIAHAGPGIAEEVYDRVNRAATAGLAAAAARRPASGASSSSPRSARRPAPPAITFCTENDPPHPTDAYGRSKLAAEDGGAGSQRAVHDPAAGADLRPRRERQSGEPARARRLAVAAAVRRRCAIAVRCWRAQNLVARHSPVACRAGDRRRRPISSPIRRR